jgi:hypothetical protein
MKSDMLTFCDRREQEEKGWDLRPSEAMEAPERRKSSEPIWMEKTLSEGRVQAGDLPTLAGVDALESPAMVEVDGAGNNEKYDGPKEVGGDEAKLSYLRPSQCTIPPSVSLP